MKRAKSYLVSEDGSSSFKLVGKLIASLQSPLSKTTSDEEDDDVKKRNKKKQVKARQSKAGAGSSNVADNGGPETDQDEEENDQGELELSTGLGAPAIYTSNDEVEDTAPFPPPVSPRTTRSKAKNADASTKGQGKTRA